MLFKTVKEGWEPHNTTYHLLTLDKVQGGRKCEGARIGMLWGSNDGTQALAMVRYKLVDVVPADFETLNALEEGTKYCIPFSLNSYASGAGTILLNNIIETYASNGARVVTLSPKDQKVLEFHLGNGAEIYGESVGSRNFDYG